MTSFFRFDHVLHVCRLFYRTVAAMYIVFEPSAWSVILK